MHTQGYKHLATISPALSACHSDFGGTPGTDNSIFIQDAGT